MKLKRLVCAEILHRQKMMVAFSVAKKSLQTLITDLAVFSSVPMSYSCVLCWQTQDNYLSWKVRAARMRCLFFWLEPGLGLLQC